MTGIVWAACCAPAACAGASFLTALYYGRNGKKGAAAVKYLFALSAITTLAACAFLFLYMAGAYDSIDTLRLSGNRLLFLAAGALALLSAADSAKEKGYFLDASAVLFCGSVAAVWNGPAAAVTAFLACDLSLTASLAAGRKTAETPVLRPKLFYSAAALCMTALYYASGSGRASVTALCAAALFMLLSSTHAWFTAAPRALLREDGADPRGFHAVYSAAIAVQLLCAYSLAESGVKPAFMGLVLSGFLAWSVYRTLTEERYADYAAADTASLGTLALFTVVMTQSGAIAVTGLLALVIVSALAAGLAVNAGRHDPTVGTLKYKTGTVRGSYAALFSYLSGLAAEAWAFTLLFTGLRRGQGFLLLAMAVAAAYSPQFLNRLFSAFSLSYRLVKPAGNASKPGMETVKVALYAALFLALWLKAVQGA